MDTTLTKHEAATWAVYYKSTWAGAWVLDSDLVPTSVTFSLAPEIPSATIIRDRGRVHKLGDGIYDIGTLDLFGKYIKIVITDENSTSATWYGYCPDPVDVLHGVRTLSDDTVSAKGRTTYNCYGLEWLLKDEVISTAYDGNQTIKRSIPYNYQGSNRFERVIGNKSSSGSYHSSTETGTDWTGQTVVDNLLFLFGVQKSLAGPSWDSNLFGIVKGSWDFTGKTFYDAISELYNPSRGMTWAVVVTNDVATVTSYSIVEDQISFDGDVLVPSGKTIQIDYATDASVSSALIRQLNKTRYDRVEVRGAPLVIAMNVHGNVQLTPGLNGDWTNDDETAYEAASDEERVTDVYRKVFSEFYLTNSWNGYVYSPGGSKMAWCTIDTDTGQVDTTTLGSLYFLDRRFLRHLPWYDEDDQATLLAPFCVWKDSDGNYRYLEKPGEGYTPLSFKVLEDKMGIKIDAGSLPNLICAEDHFQGSSYVDPEFDYDDLIAVVAMEANECARVVLDMPNAEPGEMERTLVINVPNLAVWWIAPNTILSVDASQTGEDALTRADASGRYARDDSAKMLNIANMAKAIYGQTRQIANISWNRIDCQDLVGWVLTKVSDGETIQDISTIISKVTYSFGRLGQQMDLSTSFRDIEFSRFIGSTGGSSIRQGNPELSGIPARIGAGAKSSSTYDGPFLISKNSDTQIDVSAGSISGGLVSNRVSFSNHSVEGTTGVYRVYLVITRSLEITGPQYNATIKSDVFTTSSLTEEDAKFKYTIGAVTLASGSISSVKQWHHGDIQVSGRLV